MTKERVQGLVVSLVVILFVASALGYLLAPSAMLGIVGIDSNRQVDFLVRTLAAAMLALSPGAWAARRRDDTSSQRGVLLGLAVYMFASSLVDLHAFISAIVGVAAVPSIAIRFLLGAVVVWLIPTGSRGSTNQISQAEASRATRSDIATTSWRSVAVGTTCVQAFESSAVGPWLVLPGSGLTMNTTMS